MSTVTIFNHNEVKQKVYLKILKEGLRVYVLPSLKEGVNLHLIVNYGNNDTRYKCPLTLESKYVKRGLAKKFQDVFFSDETKDIFSKLNSKVILDVGNLYSKYTIEVNSVNYVNPLRKLITSVFKYKKDNNFDEEEFNAYKSYYTASNMALVICGNVMPGGVFYQVEKILKKLKIKYEPKVIKEYIYQDVLNSQKKCKTCERKENEKLELSLEIFNKMFFDENEDYKDCKIVYDKIEKKFVVKNCSKPNAELLKYLDNIKNCNITVEEFDITRRKIYLEKLIEYNLSIDAITVRDYLYGRLPFEEIEVLSILTLGDYKKLVNAVCNKVK